MGPQHDPEMDVDVVAYYQFDGGYVLPKICGQRLLCEVSSGGKLSKPMQKEPECLGSICHTPRAMSLSLQSLSLMTTKQKQQHCHHGWVLIKGRC